MLPSVYGSGLVFACQNRTGLQLRTPTRIKSAGRNRSVIKSRIPTLSTVEPEWVPGPNLKTHDAVSLLKLSRSWPDQFVGGSQLGKDHITRS